MWVRYIYRAHLPHWTFSPTCDTAYCNTPNNHLQQKYCTPFYFWCICDLNFNTWEAWQKESCSCLHKGFSNLRKDIWLLQTTGIHFKWIFFKVWYKAHLIICFCLRGEINAPKYRKQIQRNEQIQKQRNNLPAFSECGEFAEIKLWESSRLLWWMRVGKVVKRGGSVLALTQFCRQTDKHRAPLKRWLKICGWQQKRKLYKYGRTPQKGNLRDRIMVTTIWGFLIPIFGIHKSIWGSKTLVAMSPDPWKYVELSTVGMRGWCYYLQVWPLSDCQTQTPFDNQHHSPL